MKKYLSFFLFILLVSIGTQSCRSVYQNTMFQSIDSSYINNSLAKLSQEYIIKQGDEISIKVFSRKGSTLIEAVKTNVTNSQSESFSDNISYTVTESGFVNLPIIGQFKVGGMTEAMVKNALEQRFSRDYIDPFVVIKVENRRVFLFKGNQGAVVSLNKTPTSIFEVIAKSGGVDRFMSTQDITIIRGDVKAPTVFKVDLKTFKGIQNSETMLESNDIIIIPEKNRKLFYAMQDIAPVISVPLAVLSTIMTSIVLLVSVSK